MNLNHETTEVTTAIGELSEVGTELSTSDLQAVSGGSNVHTDEYDTFIHTSTKVYID